MNDILNMFMGGGRPGGAKEKRKIEVKPIMKQMDVTLADVYNGKELEVEVERMRLCGECNGVGGSDATAV